MWPAALQPQGTQLSKHGLLRFSRKARSSASTVMRD
jgi:hypothetical protein